jgi:APA family basic amino acid/polyamine antiporter
MFLCAKSASAATAALGFSGYLLTAIGGVESWLVPVAIAAVVVLTLIVLMGIRQSNRTNITIVSITLGTLIIFALALAPDAWEKGEVSLQPFFAAPTVDRAPLVAFLEACALMFVAFTGYGRIATLGEEVREPRRTIPKAIELTLIVSAILYIVVGLVTVAAVGPEALGRMTERAAAPLEQAARLLEINWVAWVVGIGAITAMLGVLLNLILGLSRVLLAMGRRGDMPGALARLNAAGATPVVAVAVTGIVIAALALFGDVKTTWSFSAFTVLLYYAITNLSALRLTDEQRYYPRWISMAGLIGCVALAFFVETTFWVTGLAFLLIGTIWFVIARRARTRSE